MEPIPDPHTSMDSYLIPNFPILFQIFSRLARFPFSPVIIPLLYLLAPALVLSLSSSSYYFDFFLSQLDSRNTDPFHFETYDFIVVGGGSAGAVVANRLSKHNTVLLLESGGNPHPLTSVPVASPILLNQPPIDWLYETVPQMNSSFAFERNRIRWPRGRSLGGSSVLNNMIYMRGNPKDFDRWAEISGDKEWKYDRLLPFFKKLETYRGHFPNEKYHGSDGPVHVEKMRFTRGIKEWLKAGTELGYEVRDHNAGQYEGFSYLDVTMKRGTRFDTYRAYINTAKHRGNLFIKRYSLAFKIHIDRDRNAYGVSYYRHGVQKFVRADKEIIISAGTIGSAHLLMLSGVGPKEHLNSMQIKCRVNLPVGQNLHDHLVANVGPFLIEPPLSLISDRDVSPQSVLDFFYRGTGPLVSSSALSGTAYIASSVAKPTWPDTLLLLVGAGLHRSIGADQEKALSFKSGILQKYYKADIGKDANFVTVMIGKPKSRGELTLRDNYPFSQPLLNPRYLSHPEDVQVLIEGAKFVTKLYEGTRTYQSVGTSDRTAVVDSKLRVLKTRGLRVIDASVIPEVTNGNLNIPVIMIGEKGSHEIREHWAAQFLVCPQIEYLVRPKEHEEKCFYTKHI
ncbi:unnamed protein product [Allacma fusca]|uniref:Glucose-methanol-choline oxidoreductase N-terminal domain-containing protein n=1 Tax=Allacma fusca TaxID=39272 RepID=A0A8J2PS28_9HEXA|nr:unnamed protein product [Allacma fusca]